MRIKLSMVTALFLSLLFQQTVWAAPQIQTTVSDNAVFLGDLFTLTITINDSDSSFQLDSKPLKKDFNVFRPSQSRSSTYINGKSSEQTQWQITLQAKRIGELTIPALQIGNLTSDAIKIAVKKPSPQATKTADNMIFMENSLNKNSVYLEQPLIFSSKIYIAQSSNDLDLRAPDLAGATVTVYGEDKNGETIRNGIRYKTITR
ncbi:MAG: BatD family protein, partial [Psychromonas sp.]|nr:BatD family protein [Psychromonas sp.]